MARTPITVKRELYSDFFKDFTENPVSNDLARKVNEESVKESIRNLLLTDKGERPMQPRLGGDIRRLLFDNMTSATLTIIKQVVEETIRNYEPRAQLIGVDVRSTIDDNAVQITVVFNVINSEDDITLTTTISRVR